MTNPMPFSQACENNKEPILAVLKTAFATRRSVLEIGSGTGQHAVYFAANLAHLRWQTSDQENYHAGIRQWISAYPARNLLYPILLKVGSTPLPIADFDAVYTANTAHIMQPSEVRLMMATLSCDLPVGGIFCQYGPFTQQGLFSSQSNRDFHAKLVEQGYGGYRDIDELKHWAPRLALKAIHVMPANNLLLEWCKTA